MSHPLFTVIPDKDNSNHLHRLTREIICEKLYSIVQQIGEQLPMDFSYEIHCLKENNTGIANPALFHYYFQLKEAIDSENLDSILDIIHLISQQPIVVQQQMNGYPNIVSAIDSEWERTLFIKTVRKEIVSDFGVENGCELVRPVFHSDLTQQADHVKLALEILRNTDETHSYAATENLLAIKLFDGTVRGFSYQAAYGNIYIRLPKETDLPTAYYLEHIVHECAHQHLFALQLIDPVVLNHKDELFDAPIRKQKRPMDGIFHACFVLARMVRCFRKAQDCFAQEYHTSFLNRIETWFEKSHDTVHQYAKLSDQGKALFNTVKACAYD